MNNKRIETKFLFNKFDKRKFIKILKCLPLKIKKKYNSRQINNIYLDTQTNKCLSDHLDGLFKRYKLRVRWYGNFDDFLSPKLEFKIKTNQITNKKNYELITRSKKIFLSEKKYFFDLIKECLKSNGIVNFSKNLKISRIIVYNRDYYESELQNIRFTIDSNLKYKLWQNKKFQNDSHRIMTQKEFNILEVKYDSNLKSVLPIITSALNIRNQSFSKFVDYRY